VQSCATPHGRGRQEIGATPVHHDAFDAYACPQNHAQSLGFVRVAGSSSLDSGGPQHAADQLLRADLCQGRLKLDGGSRTVSLTGKPRRDRQDSLMEPSQPSPQLGLDQRSGTFSGFPTAAPIAPVRRGGDSAERFRLQLSGDA
jgi:hypothetical protein